MLKGKTGTVQHFAEHVIAERGVRHGRIVLMPTGALARAAARGGGSIPRRTARIGSVRPRPAPAVLVTTEPGPDRALADRARDMQFCADDLTRHSRGPTMRTGLTIAAAFTLVPTAALAHAGIGDGHGFVHGFAHPLGGLDHILAMVTVGIFAWQLGGRALWLVPASFVLAMAAGGALGIAGVPVPFVELGIAASVIVLGAIVALGANVPLAVAMGLVALFAIFHGHAHGTEMPQDAAGAVYAAGFVLATALLHAGGIALGFAIGRIGDALGRTAYRLGGALIALAGVAILAHLV